MINDHIKCSQNSQRLQKISVRVSKEVNEACTIRYSEETIEIGNNAKQKSHISCQFSSPALKMSRRGHFLLHSFTCSHSKFQFFHYSKMHRRKKRQTSQLLCASSTYQQNVNRKFSDADLHHQVYCLLEA